MRRILLDKPRPVARRLGVAALPYTDAIQQSILDAANSNAPTGQLTAQLRQDGYTMADLSTLYGQIASTTTLTPQVIDYLQRENDYLRDQMDSRYRMWVLIFAGGFAAYLYATRNR